MEEGGRQEETEDRANHLMLADGSFNKQGNLHARLIWGGRRTSRSPHPPAKF